MPPKYREKTAAMPSLSMPNSAALFARAKHVMPGGNTRTTVYRTPHQVYAASGDGCRITDVDGNVRIDAIGNFTSLIHGHGSKAVLDAAERQLRTGLCFGMPTAAEIHRRPCRTAARSVPTQCQ
jgi:glutamate-1-semialdehyde 2,1-aminomutase